MLLAAGLIHEAAFIFVVVFFIALRMGGRRLVRTAIGRWAVRRRR